MRSLLALVSLISTFVFSNVAANNDSVVMGIFPYASTSKLITHHKNIKKHIEKNSDHNLTMVTAKGFPAYYKNLLSNKYDIIYSPPHIARHLENKYNYQRVVMTSHNIRGVYLVRNESNFKTIKDLENKKISIAPEKTILHQIALKQLKDVGLINHQNLTITPAKTHSNAMFNVVNGDTEAAVTGIKLWKKLHPKHKKQLRMLGMTDKTTGFIIMARPGLKKGLIKDLIKLFLSFNQSIAGKNYLFKGFKTITDKEMKSLDPYASVFK